LLIGLASTRQQKALPIDKITSTQIATFGNGFGAKLLDRESGFSKQYLTLLVQEIRVTRNEVQMGS
jgi:hypothetical protein